MSRLIELLDRVREHTPRPAGFAASGRDRDEFALIAQATPQALADDPELAGVDADAFLLRPGRADHPALPDAAKVLGDRIWGIRLPMFTLELTKALVEIGCDYVILDADGTDAALLTLPDLGIVVTVDHRSDEGMIRAFAELAINGMLFRPAIREKPLSFNQLAAVQRVCGVIDRPLLLETPDGVCGADLEVLRSVETTGLIVDVPPAGRPAAVRRCMGELPPRSESRMVRRAMPFSIDDYGP